MNRSTVLRASFAIIIFVIGNLQAWDSDVPKAGLLIMLLVARLVSPIPLPGLFLVLIPAVMGLIFTGILRENVNNVSSR